MPAFTVDSPPAPPLSLSEHTFRSWDGTELFYRAWLPADGVKPGRAVLLFHRGHEHSGRWDETVRGIALPGMACFAWDARGHGRSPGKRGSAPSIAAVVRDTDAFARFLAEKHGIPIEEMAVVAHSVGAVTAAAWVHDYAPPIRALVLGTPAFRVKLYVPLAVPALRLKEKLLGPGYVSSYVKSTMLTHDPAEAARYDADPLIFRQIAVNVLLDLHDTSTRLIEDSGAIQVPTLVLAAGSDWVVQRDAQRQFFDGLSSPVKQWADLPGFSHAIFHEKKRSFVVRKIRAFLERSFERPAALPSLLDADQHGHTRDEYDRLRRPGGSPLFDLTRLSMQTLGQLSDGIQTGWRTGFDSGVSLDYVYENQPRGRTPLGRMIDRNYLTAIGWRGIRQRRVHLEKLLREAVDRARAAGQPIRVLDIACGGGRYVLETLARLRDEGIAATAVMRDYREENLDAARRLARELRVENRAEIVHGDAFDRASLAAISPRPTVAIVSGLYELFPANAPVRASLAGVADAVEPGGWLIYTGQPWHPQVEFIARVLTNREGQPWIMRRRTQGEMDQLVAAAGFAKEAQEIDEWGIFTVSLARRAERSAASRDKQVNGES